MDDTFSPQQPDQTHLTWSNELGKRVRTGSWTDQAISTTTKIFEAIERGAWEQADQFIDIASLENVMGRSAGRPVAARSAPRDHPVQAEPARFDDEEEEFEDL